MLKFGIGCEGVYRFSDALIEQAGRPLFHEFADAFEDNCTGILPCHGQHFFADDFRSQLRLVEMLVERLLDEIRLSFLYYENGPLCGAEPDDLPLDQGVCDVQYVQWNAAGAEAVGKPEQFQCPDDRVVHPALQDDSDILSVPVEELIQSVLLYEANSSRPASVDLVLLLHERERGQNDLIRSPVGVFQGFLSGERRSFVVLGNEVPVDVTRADAQLQHHRCIARL